MEKFTRQHFQKVADIIKENSNEWLRQIEGKRTGEMEKQYEKFPLVNLNKQICNDFASYFKETNPRFDEKRFMDACLVMKPNNKDN